MISLFKDGGFSIDKLDGSYVLKYMVNNKVYYLSIQEAHIPSLVKLINKLPIKYLITPNIKALRKAKGYSLRELGALVGVSRTTIYNWERQLYFPKCIEIERLKEALG
jgi:DNA-binding XRE family transcriptional regulator